MQRKYINQKLREYIPFGIYHHVKKNMVEIISTKTKTRIRVPIKDIEFLIKILQNITKRIQNPDQTESAGAILSLDPSSEICES